MPTPTIPAVTALSAATNGDETLFEVSLNGTAWTAVAEVIALEDLPSGEQTTYATTHMSSALFKEFKKNKRVEGVETEIQFNLVLGSAALTTLQAMESASGSLAYHIELKQGADIYDVTGTALFYSLRLSNPMEDRRTATITAKWTSPPLIVKRT